MNPTTNHPLGNWRLFALAASSVRLTVAPGRYTIGTQLVLLHLPRQRSKLLYRHEERLNRWYYPPVD